MEKQYKHPSGHQRQLINGFGFSEEWLKANQDGYMPFEQRDYFGAWASPWHQDGATVVVTLVFALLTTGAFIYNKEFIWAFIMLMFWGGMGGILLWYAWQDHLAVKADLRKGHVSSVCGEIKLNYQKVYRNKETRHEYTFAIVDRPNSWKVTQVQYEMLRDGNTYRVYFPANTRFLVSIEHLPEGCGELE
jgi:hypothetical protein